MRNIWYAVMRDNDDNDWGTGSTRKREALKIAKDTSPEAYIAVIEIDTNTNNAVCINEFHRNECGEWIDAYGEWVSG